MKRKLLWGCGLAAVGLGMLAVLVALALWWLFWGRGADETLLVWGRDGVARRVILERGWRAQVAGTRAALRGVSFVDRELGLAVGDRSVILWTDDGGRRWQMVRGEEERGQDFGQVAWTPERRGWVGSRGQLLHSEDGGRSWLPVSKPTNYYFGPACAAGALYFQMDAPTCGATVYLTADHGRTWQPLLATLPSNDFETVFFLDRERGWVGRKHGQLARTVDGGATWIAGQESAGGMIGKIQFVTPERGWIMSFSGHDGGLLHSTDGGVTWLLQGIGIRPEKNLRAMQFLDVKTGFLAVEHDDVATQVYRTLDGGDNWHIIGTLPFAALAINFADARTGWVVGVDGIIVRYDEP